MTNTRAADAHTPVSKHRDGYLVQPHPAGPVFRVTPHNVLGWAIHAAATGELYQAAGGALGHQSAEQAITALLHPPSNLDALPRFTDEQLIEYGRAIIAAIVEREHREQSCANRVPD
jgi:hypothetical protein